MYGAVLWRDSAQRRAVLWCEDHGALAYYLGDAVVDADLQVGDMVAFDLEGGQGMRVAQDVRLIAQNSLADLPERLLRDAARAVERRLNDPQSLQLFKDAGPNVVSLHGGGAIPGDGDRGAAISDDDPDGDQSDDDETDGDDFDGDGPATGGNVLRFRFTGTPRNHRRK